MEELASILFHSQTQAHVFHLGVSGPGSYASHKALQKYYESIDGLTDGLIESYQGKYGLIKFKPVLGIDNDCSCENIVAYFDKLITIVDTLSKGPGLQDGFIQNQIDTINELLFSTRYKLVNLA
jgi:hypothetical protein